MSEHSASTEISTLDPDQQDMVVRLHVATGIGKVTCHEALKAARWNMQGAMDWIHQQVSGKR